MCNRKNYSSVLSAILIAVYFFSCSKNENDTNHANAACSDFAAPEVYNDGPQEIGGTLHLSATSDEQDAAYEWTGPKNFSSQDQNVVINNISFDAGGIYYVRVSNGACTSSTSPTEVVINPPCNIADNSGVFGILTWNFYALITCESNSSGHYLIKGSGANGDLEIKFAANNPPSVNKIYDIDSTLNPVFDSTKVQITITNSSGNVFAGQSGNVYVSNYGNISVVFCNIPFKSSATGATLTGSAKLNCQ